MGYRVKRKYKSHIKDLPVVAFGLTQTPRRDHNAFYLKDKFLLSGKSGAQAGNIYYGHKYLPSDVIKTNLKYNLNLTKNQELIDVICRHYGIEYFSVSIKDPETKLIQSKQCLSTKNQIDLKVKLDEWMDILESNKKISSMDEEIFTNNNGI